MVSKVQVGLSLIILARRGASVRMLRMVRAILLVTVPAATCVELGQVAWKSGYLGQIIINVGSHVGSCQFVSQAIELGLELQVLVGDLVILMTFHVDNSGGLLAFLAAMDND
jgi:hypothetical protein